jgi:hypothetical protein
MDRCTLMFSSRAMKKTARFEMTKPEYPSKTTKGESEYLLEGSALTMPRPRMGSQNNSNAANAIRATRRH